MTGPSLAPPGRGPLLAAGAHVVLFLAATAFLPRPGSRDGDLIRAALWLLPPAYLAVRWTIRRANATLGAASVVWAFLAGACALRTLGLVGFIWSEVVDPSLLTEVLSLMAQHASFGLLVVGLLLRPDRSRPSIDARDGLLLATVLAFLPAYAVLLFPRGSNPVLLIRAMEDVLPALLSLRLARAAASPWGMAYGRMALGLGLGALLAIPARASYFARGRDSLEPIDVAWILPLWGVFAAAAVRTAESWLAAGPGEPADGGNRIAAAAVAVPGFVEVLARGLRLPGDVEARTILVLATASALALFVGLRLRRSTRERAHPVFEEGRAEGSPELMRLASGTAHELNNPFMAVALAAELAVARGGDEPPLRALQQSVHDAAAAVRRFQLLASRRSLDAGPGREGPR
jgi:signal transduction histidine kinase